MVGFGTDEGDGRSNYTLGLGGLPDLVMDKAQGGASFKAAANCGRSCGRAPQRQGDAQVSTPTEL